MNGTDLQILYTALAYIAVYRQSGEEPHETEPAKVLARHIERYCRENVENVFPPVRIVFVHDQNIAELETEIAAYAAQYRHSGFAMLPQDIDRLRTLHLYLQIRNMQRAQSMFYATATNEFLTKAIQNFLKAEIEEPRRPQ